MGFFILCLTEPVSRKAVHESRLVDYEEFLTQPEMLSLKAEIAFLRSFLIEYRESIQERHLSKVAEMVDNTVAEISRDWQCEDWEVKKLRKVIMGNLVQVFGASASITSGDAQVMLKIADSIGKTVERGKAIEEGITLKVDWGQCPEKLQAFLQKIVFSLVPIEQRAIMAQKAKQFFGATPMDQLAIGSGNVIDHPAARVVR